MKLLDIIFESVVDLNESPKPMSKDEFIQSAQSIHKNKDGTPKYTYDNVNYIDKYTKVSITCPLHDDFPQTPRNHLRGFEGCKKCYSKLMSSNTEDFIKKAQKKHFLYDENGKKIPKYTYDNVKYVNSYSDVNITCSIHGDFPQPPHSHLKGDGCDKCGIISRTSNKEDFIQKAQKIHFLYDDDENKIPKYTYDNVDYKGSFIKVNITCPIHSPIHGDFPQRPSDHLSGNGCNKCYRDSTRSNKEDFTKDAQSMKVHQNKDGTPKYTYDNVVYITSDIKVNITCPIHSPIHGDFPQLPSNHLQGVGCPWCNESKGEKELKQILYEKSINYIQQKKYDDCISYRRKIGLSKRCFKLKFDFYLPENNTLVEYDGGYHFKQNSNISLEEYTYNVLNDREKNDYTKAKNIKLIRIGYLDIKNIEEELMKGLDSNDQLYLSTKYPIDKGWRDTTIKV